MIKCEHCGGRVPSKHDQFCCMGCEIAYKIIKGLDLKKYYEYCINIYNKAPMKVHEISNELTYDDHIITVNETSKHYRIHLIVEGIHCGSCVWLIENTLLKQEGVLNARLNLSTKRLTIEWQREKTYINKLIKLIFDLGYKLIPFSPDESERQSYLEENNLLRCLVVSGFGATALMMILFGIWAGNLDDSMTYHLRAILHWISALITIPVIMYSGRPFFISAYNAIKAKRSNMDVPVSIAALVTLAISIQETVRGSHYTYYDAAVSLIFFLLIGRYLDFKVRNRARSMARNLILSRSQSVTLINRGKLILVSITRAKVGDIAFVSAGEKVPVDGVIVEGDSEVDTSLITGESMPVKVTKGSQVVAGTINMNSPLKVKILKLGEDTTLAEIIKLMENAEQGRAKYIALADRIARLYTPIVLSLTFITLIGWYLQGATLNDALLNAVSVLIITCPCALGLAVPIVQVVACSRLIASGIIIKTKDALEKLAAIDYVLFDKTGTLTLGKPTLINYDSIKRDQMNIIASLASHSKHPLCKALNQPEKTIRFAKAVEEVKGFGLKTFFKTKEIKLGSRKWCNINNNDDQDENLEMWFVNGTYEPIKLIFRDQLKHDAKEIVSYFRGIPMEILSGDRKKVVEKISTEVGINNFKAEYTPQDKFNYIRSLENKKVLMIGDGLNDSAALKAAFISMSPAESLEITQTVSDIVFQGEKLYPVKEAYCVARFSNKLVKQNLFLSLVYNIITVPIAMLGLAGPVIAAIVMSTSSIIVVLNSLRISHKKF